MQRPSGCSTEAPPELASIHSAHETKIATAALAAKDEFQELAARWWLETNVAHEGADREFLPWVLVPHDLGDGPGDPFAHCAIMA